MKKFLLLCSCIVPLASCSVLESPEKIANSIPIYENQTEIMDGVYFNRPYKTNFDYKTFLEIVNLNSQNVDSIGLALVGPKKLEVISYKPFNTEKHIVKGKLKRGTFQIESKNFFFGIPYLFFFNSEEKVRISVGVLDEIIVQHYHYKYSQLFGHTSEETTTDYYYFSKTLEVIP
ncbi:MAG TPA: hypothetical protein VFM82_06110 [Flavobacteriaceae bacterium]|nr:hypothetical protein [Flavobacteriaceae bacterium]